MIYELDSTAAAYFSQNWRPVWMESESARVCTRKCAFELDLPRSRAWMYKVCTWAAQFLNAVIDLPLGLRRFSAQLAAATGLPPLTHWGDLYVRPRLPPDELPFVLEIDRGCSDLSRWMVYGDWLADQNDPRGPVIQEWVTRGPVAASRSGTLHGMKGVATWCGMMLPSVPLHRGVPTCRTCLYRSSKP